KNIPILLVLALLGLSGTADAANAANAAAAGYRHGAQGVEGRVLGETSPLSAAGVWAWQLSDLKHFKVETDAQGNFRFDQLPAGVYQILAHKAGFDPVLVKLHRATADAYQFVELQLVQARARKAGPKSGPAGDDFWSVRSRVPSDILRDMEGWAPADDVLASLAPLPGSPEGGLPLAGFQTQVEAMAGIGDISSLGSSLGEGQVSQGRVGIEGRFGAVELDLDGPISQFSADGGIALGAGPGLGAVGGSAGQTSALSLRVAAGADSRIQLTSLSNRLTPRDDAAVDPIDFEHYRVSWSQGVGENGRSDFAAQYTTENNYHRHGVIDPLIIPESSRTLRLEGAFTTSLGDRTTLQTGARYRERRFVLSSASRPEDQPVQDDLDLFSRGSVQVRPAVLVEYGLYSTLSDGSLALTPQGGIVFQLGSQWQARLSGSLRAYEDVQPAPDFLPALFGADDLCEQVGESCYQLLLSRGSKEDDRSLSLGAVHRTVGETVRLYFSDDFFDRLESLYLVPGDTLPEVRFQWSQRLAPSILTTLQSSVASGGGGTFVGADRRPYKNDVRYVVTSLDTRFQATSTGVFVAFHQLAQSLAPADGGGGETAEMDTERLRLRVSQDLGFLMDLATEWAVQLNMELSRGTLPSGQSDPELRHRFLGGLAVKF
ncbi:MAG TPA: carboxypeptidase-like regulatory domain-containing protein, partial [Thermoanaerobaculia bacterium]|nr:carboxypeptidase-like regulatory domain-containing protein [Thermoanaerobaculia bacterium]